MDLDYVDHIVDQWERERPDLDVSPMSVFGRITRAASLLERRIEPVFTDHDLPGGRFDVLAALRRAGPPYILSPTELYNSLLISSGAMTHRLDRLTENKLIERLPNPDDGRGLLVKLTSDGFGALDAALDDHLTNEKSMVEYLTPSEQQALVAILRKLLLSLGDTGAPKTAEHSALQAPELEVES